MNGTGNAITVAVPVTWEPDEEPVYVSEGGGNGGGGGGDPVAGQAQKWMLLRR
jgi:hypothetical protein